MIQINITLFIQLVNFLLLLVILNAILYKPILAKIREREAAIKGNRNKAEELAQRVEEQEKRHQDELAKARQTAAQEKTALMGEAKSKEAEILDKARGEASKIIDEAKKAIQVQASEVRAALTTQMTPLAGTMAERILGRSV